MKFFTVEFVWKLKSNKLSPMIGGKIEGIAAENKEGAKVKALGFFGPFANELQVIGVMEL